MIKEDGAAKIKDYNVCQKDYNDEQSLHGEIILGV